jgi:autotransporter-associated beta strand protein
MKLLSTCPLARRALLGAILLAPVSPCLQAASYWWDLSPGLDNGVGGNGTFSTSSLSWSTTVGGSDPLLAATGMTGGATTGHDLRFAGTPGAINWTNNVNHGSLQFQVSGYSVTSNQANRLLAGGPIQLANNVNLTFSNTGTGGNIGLSGASLVLAGGTGSTVTIAGATGDMLFDLRAGASIAASAPITITATAATTSLTIRSNNNTGTIESGITNDSPLALTLAAGLADNTNNSVLRLNGGITGSSGVVFSAGRGTTAAGQVQLGAASAYAGDTRFEGVASATFATALGSVKLFATNGLSPASRVTMGAVTGKGENLDLNGFNQTLAHLVSNADGTGAIINTSAITDSVLTVNGAATDGAFGLPIRNGAKKIALVRSGTGTTTLSSSNPYTGGTTVSGGRLVLGHATNTLADTGAVTVSGGELALVNNSDTIGALTLSSGQITGTGGTLTATSVNVSGPSSLSANLAGPSGITFAFGVAGDVFLGGTNSTYSGVTYMNASSNIGLDVHATQVGALSPNSQLRTGGSTLDTNRLVLAATGDHVMNSLQLGGVLNLAGPASGQASLTFAQGGFITNTASRSLNVGGGATLVFGSSVGMGTFDIVGATAANNRSVNISGAGDVIFNSIIRDNASGSAADFTGGVIMNGNGTLTLNAANLYTGHTTVNSGRLRVNNSTGWGSGLGPVNVNGGVLSGSGFIAGATVVAAGGTLSPGNGIGLLSFNNKLTLGGSTTLEINGPTRGTQHDGVAVGGDLVQGGDLSIAFGAASAAGASYELFAVNGTVSGDFSSVALTGSHSTALSLSGGLWSGAANSLTFTFNPATGFLAVAAAASDPYATWLAAQSWPSPAASAPEADPDADGLRNLLEYALGTDPLAASASPVVDITGSGPRFLILGFSRIADPALIYTVEASPDLVTWGPIWTSTGAQNVAGPVTVPDTSAIGSSPRRFLRLNITR